MNFPKRPAFFLRDLDKRRKVFHLAKHIARLHLPHYLRAARSEFCDDVRCNSPLELLIELTAELRHTATVRSESLGDVPEKGGHSCKKRHIIRCKVDQRAPTDNPILERRTKRLKCPSGEEVPNRPRAMAVRP